MNTTSIAPFYIIGIAVRTTNENMQAAADIPQLWNKFLSENIMAKIPNKIGNDIYSVYTDYEADYTKPYTTLLGCKVSSLDTIPEGFTGKSFAGSKYTTFTAKGKLADGIVFQEWTKIWNTDIPRAYTADFEIYGEKAQNPDDAEIDIFIAVIPN
jgi:predicted transcriptional regulator YdeE